MNEMGLVRAGGRGAGARAGGLPLRRQPVPLQPAPIRRPLICLIGQAQLGRAGPGPVAIALSIAGGRIFWNRTESRKCGCCRPAFASWAEQAIDRAAASLPAGFASSVSVPVFEGLRRGARALSV
mgnify:CR=1 FL=1